MKHKHLLTCKSLLLILLTALPMMAFSQRECQVSGEYTYYVPSNVTIEQARMTAEKHARIAALTKEFNLMVYQTNMSVLSNRNDDELDEFYSIGVTESRGEWIKDTKPTDFDVTYDYENGELVVKAKVWGIAREVKGASTILDAKMLRNGTDPRYESNLFKHGDNMYLYFRSPEDGWLCVFLLDRFTKEVDCLLPYRNSPEGAVQVKHDKEYVFFKADPSQPGWNLVDEYVMTCTNSSDYNEFYIVFSPHKFSKPVGGESALADKPLVYDMETLTKWLWKCQSKDKDMVVEKRLVKISKE